MATKRSVRPNRRVVDASQLVFVRNGVRATGTSSKWRMLFEDALRMRVGEAVEVPNPHKRSADRLWGSAQHARQMYINYADYPKISVRRTDDGRVFIVRVRARPSRTQRRRS